MLAQTSDTSQSEIRYIFETEWGKVPTVGSMSILRFVSEGLNIERNNITSEEIRSDRQIPDLIPTKVEATGNINGELSYETYDDFIRAVMGNQWSPELSAVVTGVSVVDGKLVYPDGEAPPFVFGMAILLSGFTIEEGNNRIVVVKSKEEGTDTVTVVPALADQNAEAGEVTARGQVITNGVERSSFYIEKEFKDVGRIISYLGMLVDKMAISVESENKATVNFDFLGSNGAAGELTAVAGDPVPANTNDIMAAGTQDSTILENGEVIGLIKSISLDVMNNLRGKTAIGTVGNVDIGIGRFNVTGQITTYFRDYRLYQKYLANQSSSILFTLKSIDSGTYVFYLPNIKLTESMIKASGPDQDVMLEGGYQALVDDVLKKTLFISKIKN